MGLKLLFDFFMTSTLAFFWTLPERNRLWVVSIETTRRTMSLKYQRPSTRWSSVVCSVLRRDHYSAQNRRINRPLNDLSRSLLILALTCIRNLKFEFCVSLMPESMKRKSSSAIQPAWFSGLNFSRFYSRMTKQKSWTVLHRSFFFARQIFEIFVLASVCFPLADFFVFFFVFLTCEKVWSTILLRRVMFMTVNVQWDLRLIFQNHYKFISAVTIVC